MRLRNILFILFIVSNQLNAATTNLDVAEEFILFSSSIPLFYPKGSGGIEIRPENIFFSDLKENVNGRVDAIIDLQFDDQIYRYQEQNLFYNYVADLENDNASYGLTKSGIMTSSPSSSINVVRDGTELLELNKETGIFSPTGIYVLNLLETTCLAVCDDPYPELTALNQVPLPGAAFLFLSSFVGLGWLKRFRD